MFILYLLIIVFVLFSRFTVIAPTGTGAIPFLIIPIAIVVFLFVLNRRSINKQWLLGFSLFLTSCIFNHSNVLSVGLVSIALLAHLLIKSYSMAIYIDSIRRFTLKIIIVFCVIIIFDIIGVLDFSIWSSSKAEIGYPRLRMFSDEASYFGVVMASLIFISGTRFQAWLYTTLFILTQSYYSLIYFILVFFRKYNVISYLAAFFASAIIFPLLFVDTDVFFSNSGYIRLIGVNLISSMSSLDLLVGSGIGSGDDALTNLFQLYGVDSGSGFLFTWFYDIGFLGFLGYYLCICKSKYDVLLLSLLLLNFGGASFYIVFVFAVARYQHQKADVH